MVNSPLVVRPFELQSSIRRSVLVLLEFNSERTASLFGDNKSSLSVPIQFNFDRAAKLGGGSKEVHPWKHATRC
jgi:hypothetical protein